MAQLPTFKAPFLIHICDQLEARGKAIKHNAKFEWATKQPDEYEWLTVNITPDVGHYSIFQFAENNLGWVYVRSKSRGNRGKILFEIENIHVIDNAPGIVEAIEATVANSRALESDALSDTANKIRAVWSTVEVSILEAD